MKNLILLFIIVCFPLFLTAQKTSDHQEKKQIFLTKASDYRAKAKRGNAEAQFFLAECYKVGAGVDQDYTQAVYWYKKAAEQGFSAAQIFLGNCYFDGKGVAENKNYALYWLQKAVEDAENWDDKTLIYFIKIRIERLKEEGYTAMNPSESLYNVINAYIKEVNAKEELSFAAVVLEKTVPLMMYTEVSDSPGSIIEEIYGSYFREIIKNKILNRKDMEFVKAQLTLINKPYDESYYYSLDSTQIALPVITDMEYKEIFLNFENSYEQWDAYYSKYKGCYLAFSNLLFNEDKSKVYFETSQMCGRLHGHGEIVVMEKKRNSWKIIYRAETWVS